MINKAPLFNRKQSHDHPVLEVLTKRQTLLTTEECCGLEVNAANHTMLVEVTQFQWEQKSVFVNDLSLKCFTLTVLYSMKM